MSLNDFLSAGLYEIQPYKSDPPQDAVAFIGSPRQHPYDDSKVILISDPRNGRSALFEFKACDIVGAKELPSPVNESGKSLNLVKLWVRRGAKAIRYEPFEVEPNSN